MGEKEFELRMSSLETQGNVIGFFSKELRDLIFDDLYFLTDMTYFIFLIEPIVTHYKDCMLIWHLTATLITVIDKKITLKVSNIRDEN